MEAIWGRTRSPGLGFSPVCPEVCGTFGAAHYTQSLQEQQREGGGSQRPLPEPPP